MLRQVTCTEADRATVLALGLALLARFALLAPTFYLALVALSVLEVE